MALAGGEKKVFPESLYVKADLMPILLPDFHCLDPLEKHQADSLV